MIVFEKLGSIAACNIPLTLKKETLKLISNICLDSAHNGLQLVSGHLA